MALQLPVIDELGYDLVDTAGVSMADTVFESLDHGAADSPRLALRPGPCRGRSGRAAARSS